VTIGSKKFCTNCGMPVGGASQSATKSLDLSRTPAPAPTPQAAPKAAAVAPVTPANLMRDVAVTNSVKPSGEFHARLKPAKGGVLDLRATTPTPALKPVEVEKPKPKKHVSIHGNKMHTPAKAQAEIPVAKTPEVRLHQTQKRLEEAGKIKHNDKVSRFGPKATTTAPPAPAIAPEPAPEPVLNPKVAEQHAHLNRLLELSADHDQPVKKTPRQPTRANFATAAAAIAIIGGYIWFHNYPHLAISTAADKAGFSASLPNFVPSSYNLNGPVSYAPGLVTLNFASPSFKDPLKIIQQPTTWDTRSLLDNYVAQKSSSYSTVTGQGLTIYLFNNGQQAAWVNQGIWYTVVGATHIGRDQLLKMAYSF
jgi:hypothetical protein